MKRVYPSDIPLEPTPCPISDCVYNEDGVCDEPRINRYNGDAWCYRLSTRRLLSLLASQAIPEAEEE